MSNPFAHVAERKITDDKTSWCKLPGLFSHRFPDAPDPELELRHAGKPNEGYWNADITAQAIDLERSVNETVMSDGEIDHGATVRRRFEEEMRAGNRDRELYPRYVIVGWRNMIDNDGQSVEFSLELCAKLVAALAEDDFRRVRRHAVAVDNFRPGRALSAAARSAFAGKSASASPGS